jgi:hypothetical protein
MNDIENKNEIIAILKPEAKKLLTAINLNESLNIDFLHNGIKIAQTDNSNIAMQSIFLNASEMNKYICNTDMHISIENAKNFKLMIKTLNKKQDIKIKADSISISVTDTIKNYVISIKTIEPENQKEPNVIFGAGISLPIDDFKSMLKDAKMINEYITLKLEGTILNIHANGDAGELDSEYNISESNVLKSGNAISTFNIEYLTKALKDADSKSDIRVWIKTNEPLKMIYTVGGTDNTYYLAPYMDDVVIT